MSVRRIAALLTVPLLLVPVAACSDDSGGKQGAVPAVTGDAGKKPKIAAGEGEAPKDLKVKVLEKGDGEKVAKGEILRADYLGQTWDGNVFDNSYDRGAPASFPIGVGSVVKGWDEGLVGQNVGSRVELVIPPDKGYGPQEKPGIPADSTLVFVVDIKDSISTKLDGKVVEPEDGDLPKVSTEDNGKPASVEIPKGAKEPKEIVSETVIEGDGKPVGAKSSVLVNYAAVLWKDGSQVGSTEQSGPQEYPVEQLKPWGGELVGKKAGSRVLVVVPKDKLSKEQQQVGSTVVFVVDVLAVF
ncbi:FKBP-type peptidyl-prolyl cis-trans isomerase [Streptomyces thermolineatus]|uniref:Peptidyl-prolyl cis-trans isomerase n=1 Tax=Streptomyces thermolineatus TaxID=44033 RepID=A0ABP5YIH5_9ACTN|nr:FKBP-type peptidyl-prolyl cis-trans isomerase [Streptomyces sp. HB2AG]